MASPQLFGAAPEKPLEASALEVRVPAEAGVESVVLHMYSNHSQSTGWFSRHVFSPLYVMEISKDIYQLGGLSFEFMEF